MSTKDMTLRDLLNAGRWKTQTLDAWAVDVVHRGAPGDQRTVVGSRIAKVAAAGVEVLGADKDSDTVFIPYHRFLEVRGSQHQRLWAQGEPIDTAALGLEAESTATPAHTLDPGEELTSDIDVVLSRGPLLVIDGSAGEGGGQILRSSLTLSMLTGIPFAIDRIRAGRKKPGLARQHLTCVQAAAEICSATLSGATLGSTRLEFHPGPVRPGDYVHAIGTAGATSLVLQTVALPLAMADAPSTLTVTGGTHARWAPPFPFLMHAWVPLMQRMRLPLDVSMTSAGFYPAGGGKLVARLGKAGGALPAPLALLDQPRKLELRLEAIVSNLTEAIARRELKTASVALDGFGYKRLRLTSGTVRSPGPGNAMWLEAHGGAVTNVFTAIGERGVPAEDVGLEVASQFVAWHETGSAIEEHLADQLMLPLAIAGAGSFTTAPLTPHAWTNIEVVAAFTGRRFRVRQQGAERVLLEL